MNSSKFSYACILVGTVVFLSNMVIAQSSDAILTTASINATGTINSSSNTQSSSYLDVKASSNVSESTASVLMTTIISSFASSSSMTIGLNNTFSGLVKAGESTSDLSGNLTVLTIQTIVAAQTVSLVVVPTSATYSLEMLQTLSTSLSSTLYASQSSAAALQTPATSLVGSVTATETIASTPTTSQTMALSLTISPTIVMASTPSSLSLSPLADIQSSPTTALLTTSLPSITTNSTIVTPSPSLSPSLSTSSNISAEYPSISVMPSFTSTTSSSSPIISPSSPIASSSTPVTFSSTPVTSSSTPVTSSSTPVTSSSTPVTSSSTPVTTPAPQPTTPTSPSGTVMTIKVEQTNSQPMNLPMNFTEFKEFNSCLSNLQIKQCIVSISLIKGTNYVYKFNGVSEIPFEGNALIASIKPFVCEVDDLYTLFQKSMGNMSCTRQDCPSTSSSCLNITMGNTLWYWSPTQSLSIVYDPKVVAVICTTCVPASSTTTTQPTIVVTTQTTTSDPLEGGLIGKRNSGHSAIILGVILGILVVVVLVILGVLWFKWRVGHTGSASGLHSNHKVTGHRNRGARLESVNSDASELAFTDLQVRQSGGPAHATLDVSSTSYVSLNSKGPNSGQTGQYENVDPNANTKGRYENVGVKGGTGKLSKNTPEYSEIGVQTSRPANAYSSSTQQATVNPRSSNVYNEPADSLGYSLAKNPDTERNNRHSAEENQYSEIGDMQAELGFMFKTSET